jgi:hypothetical protein
MLAWSDELKGANCSIDLATKLVTRITTEKGFYYSPKYSNKGDKSSIAKARVTRNWVTPLAKIRGIYIIGSLGGTPQMVINNGIHPQFTADDSHIYYQSYEDGKKAFRIMDVSGANQRTFIYIAIRYAVCPKSRW